MNETIEVTIPGRPATKKNSRVNIAGGGTIPSKAYREWAKVATKTLEEFWGEREMLEDGPYKLEVATYRKTRKWVNDIDAPLTSVMDVLKGVIFRDDNPNFIGSATTDMYFDCEEDKVVIKLTRIASNSNPEGQ